MNASGTKPVRLGNRTYRVYASDILGKMKSIFLLSNSRLVLNAKKSLSSYQLACDLELNQKTAWYILTCIRVNESMKGDNL